MEKKYLKLEVGVNGRLRPIREYPDDSLGRMAHKTQLLLDLVHTLTDTLIEISTKTRYRDVNGIIDGGLRKAAIISLLLKSPPKL